MKIISKMTLLELAVYNDNTSTTGAYPIKESASLAKVNIKLNIALKHLNT